MQKIWFILALICTSCTAAMPTDNKLNFSGFTFQSGRSLTLTIEMSNGTSRPVHIVSFCDIWEESQIVEHRRLDTEILPHTIKSVYVGYEITTLELSRTSKRIPVHISCDHYQKN